MSFCSIIIFTISQNQILYTQILSIVVLTLAKLLFPNTVDLIYLG